MDDIVLGAAGGIPAALGQEADAARGYAAASRAAFRTAPATAAIAIHPIHYARSLQVTTSERLLGAMLQSLFDYPIDAFSRQ